MSSHEENMRNQDALLKDLGIKSSNEAVKVLHSLLTQNIINPSQIKASCKKNTKKKPKKAQKGSNINRYMTRHIALRFHYDGATYNGLAQNVNSPTDNSVEKALFAALQKTCLIDSRESCGYSRSGRTDKGVSAFGQVVALRVRSAFPIGSYLIGEDSKRLLQEDSLPKNHLEKLKCLVPKKKGKNNQNDESDLVEKEMLEKDFAQLINNVLPSNIRILGWSPVSDEFSARFSTRSRLYRYFFVRRDLDLQAMELGCKYMIGRHDFRNLCKMNCEEVDNFERVIHEGKIIVSNGNNESDGFPYEEYCNFSKHEMDSGDTSRQVCYIEIKGQAFLWHQIRCIASVLFMIGQGLEKPEVVQELLDIKANPGKPSYQFAPDLPLVLHSCEYSNLRFGHSVQNLWRTSCDLENRWEALSLTAERLKNGLLSIRDEAEVKEEDVYNFVKATLEEKATKESKRRGYRIEPMIPSLPSSSPDGIIKWSAALDFIKNYTDLTSTQPVVSVHIPLMERGRGSTYEEKIQAITRTNPVHGHVSSKRRREAYEQNIKKKKCTKDEDELFYKKMTSQGGSGF